MRLAGLDNRLACYTCTKQSKWTGKKERDKYKSLYSKIQIELREREDAIDKLAKTQYKAKTIIFETCRLINEALEQKGLDIHRIEEMKIRMGDVLDCLQMINTSLKFHNNVSGQK